jgi:multicomponent Na+:H+ antiporter subunit B
MILITVLLITVADLPRYGFIYEPSTEVTERYVTKGLEETGAVNIVAGIILDYRAFDTLGESFVLFCALNSVLILLRREEGIVEGDDNPYFNLTGDGILRKTMLFTIPAVFVYGIYVLLNGHLSPGGGFSGGAVMGAAVILLSAAYGKDVAGRFITEKRFKAVSFIALSFYCLSKSYSFFTGANGLESIIGKGIPGAIISSGLILPLNVAVGMVVTCTMYGIYRMFREGDF